MNVTPLHAPHVASTFAVAFLGTSLLLLFWYEPSVLADDPVVLFMWAGTAYVAAYSVTEFVRKACWFTSIGILGGLLLLAFDVARHGNLIVQRYVPHPLDSNQWLQLSSSYCAITGANQLPCRITEYLATNPMAVLACVATTLLLALIGKLLSFSSREQHDAAAQAVEHVKNSDRANCNMRRKRRNQRSHVAQQQHGRVLDDLHGKTRADVLKRGHKTER